METIKRIIISTILTLLTYFIVPPPDSQKTIISVILGLSTYFLTNVPVSSTASDEKIVYQKIRPSPGTNYLLVSDYEKLKSFKDIPITIVDNGKDCYVVLKEGNEKTILSFFFPDPSELSNTPNKNIIINELEDENIDYDNNNNSQLNDSLALQDA